MDDMVEGAPLPEDTGDFSSSQFEGTSNSGSATTSGSGSEITSIGQHIHREDRENYVTKPTINVPEASSQRVLSPVTRNPLGVESPTDDQEESSNAFLPQEQPLIHTPKPPKPGRLVKLGAAAAAVLGLSGIAGFFINNQVNGGGENNDNKGAIVSVATGTPTTGPTLAETPQHLPTLKPTNTPTPEATTAPTSIVETPISSEVENALSKFYKKIGQPIHTYGNHTLAVTEEAQNLTCVKNAQGFPEHCPLQERYLDPTKKNAVTRLDDFYKLAFYFAWNDLVDNKPANEQDLVIDWNQPDDVIMQQFEVYKQRLSQGDNFSFPIQAYGEKPEMFSQKYIVNPNMPTVSVTLPDNKNVLVNWNSTLGISFFMIDGVLITADNDTSNIGIQILKSEGKTGLEPQLNTLPSTDLISEMVALGDRSVHEALKNSHAKNYLNADYKRLQKEQGLLNKSLIDNYVVGSIPDGIIREK